MNLSDKALRRLTLAAAVVFLVLAAVGCTGLLWYDEQFPRCWPDTPGEN